MNNRGSLKQARFGQTHRIGIDPMKMNVSRRTATKTDSTGKPVIDYTQPPATVSLTVRVMHEASGPVPLGPAPAGQSSNLGRMVMSDYRNVIQTDDLLVYEGVQYKVGKVDTLRKFGGIYGYQAPLTEADNGHS